MTSNGAFAEIAALAGDPARAGMMHALMDGRALPANELAAAAGLSAAGASGHLAQLLAGGLLTVVREGRHRYYQLTFLFRAGLRKLDASKPDARKWQKS